jgi:hypothetical protein
VAYGVIAGLGAYMAMHVPVWLYNRFLRREGDLELDPAAKRLMAR